MVAGDLREMNLTHRFKRRFTRDNMGILDGMKFMGFYMGICILYPEI